MKFKSYISPCNPIIAVIPQAKKLDTHKGCQGDSYACRMSPCPRNSRCIASWPTYTCACDAGYLGANCSSVCDFYNPCSEGVKSYNSYLYYIILLLYLFTLYYNTIMVYKYNRNSNIFLYIILYFHSPEKSVFVNI